MIRALTLLAASARAFAHMMSMSTGDLRIEGTAGRFELRMPLYEIAHVKDASRVLLERVRFASGGLEATLVSRACLEDAASAAYICKAEYRFAAPVDKLEVESSIHAVTVPNHVHLLRAEMDGRRDQALLDVSFSKATLRFRPPTAFETFATQAGAGALRAAGGAVHVLLLAALALAARTRRELVALALTFLAGQAAAVAIVPLTGWLPAPRFVEAAAALSIAYLAVEILLLPRAGARWAVAGALGGFHGLYFQLLLRETEYSAWLVLAGAAVAQTILIALLAFALARIGRAAERLHPVQVGASALLIFGMGWFVMRLRG
jgi:hypothetical protein